jgi:hypothetical protein
MLTTESNYPLTANVAIGLFNPWNPPVNPMNAPSIGNRKWIGSSVGNGSGAIPAQTTIWYVVLMNQVGGDRIPKIPTGFKSPSPGLRGTSYLGSCVKNIFNPNGVASSPRRTDATPSGLMIHRIVFPG